MSSEHKKQNIEQNPSIRRSPQEIEKRIQELEQRIEGYDVWIHKGYSEIPEPKSQIKKGIYEGKLSELEWILGKDISVTDGIY